jgi:class III poly(R)-hydroxyalkanoic acid synthase PhaE subunit
VNGSNDWYSVQQDLWRFWRNTFAEHSAPKTTGSDFWSEFLKNLGLPADAPISKSLQDLSRAFQGFYEQSGAQSKSPFAQFSALFGGAPQWPFGVPNTSSGSSFSEWGLGTPHSFADLQDLPPLGIFREWQSAHREVIDAQIATNKASQALARQLAPIYQTAFKRFIKAINTKDDGEEDITSLRGLYDLWVSLAEQAYSEKVMTDQYGKIFGKYINANARLRLATQSLLDDAAEAMNLPNRREVNAIIERQHLLEEQIRELLLHRESATHSAALQNQVESLTQRVATIERPQTPVRKIDRRAVHRARAGQSTQSTAETKRPAATKKVSRKKTKPGDSEFDIGVFDKSTEPRNH